MSFGHAADRFNDLLSKECNPQPKEVPMNKMLVILATVVLAALPSAALAQEPDDDGDLLIRINGDVTVGPGETVGSVIVIDGNVVIEGTVTDSVLVIEGDVRVSGTIENDLAVISGSADLQAGSSVDNVSLVRSDLTRAEGATVTGDIDERDDFRIASGVLALFSVIFWLAMTVAVIVAGLVFAAVGGKQLLSSAETMTGDAVNTILGIVFVWLALPILAVIAIVTVVGLPLGLGIFFFLMPALWFLGLIVAGTRLGTAIVQASGRQAGVHPYLAAFVGLLILQLLILVPILGAIVTFLAGVWGAGALAVTAFRAAGGKGFTSDPRPAGPASPATQG
jgi:hypothetical protein